MRSLHAKMTFMLSDKSCSGALVGGMKDSAMGY